VLLEAADEGLMDLLGESCRALIYGYLKRSYSLKKEEIPQRLKDFHLAIQKIYGCGVVIIETVILRVLCEKMHVNYEIVKEYEFPTAVEKLKARTM